MTSPRYWEEVQVGDQVAPIVKGPLSSDDMLNFVDVVRGTLNFAYFREHWRRHPQDIYWDPETGMPDSWDASMIKESVAQVFGFPSLTTPVSRGSAGWRTWSPTGQATWGFWSR